MKVGIVLAFTLAGVCTGESAACVSSLPPLVARYEGETLQQYNDRYTAARQQQEREEIERQQRENLQLWDRSLNVELAEVVESVRDVEISGYGKLPRVRVKLIAPLKGARVTGEAELRTVTVTTCGPTPIWDVLGGKPGQRFVLFLSRDQFDQASVVGSTAVANLSDTRVLEALAKLVK